jgi:hypothetical protein
MIIGICRARWNEKNATAGSLAEGAAFRAAARTDRSRVESPDVCISTAQGDFARA